MDEGLQFEVAGEGDEPIQATTKSVFSDLQADGYNPTGMSADGTKITLQDAQGPYEINVNDAIKNVYGKEVKSMSPNPEAVDYDNINLEHRYIIQSPNLDDDAKRSILESKMKRETGDLNPIIAGKGDDWFHFDPQEMRWKALTNKPGFDVSDIAGYAPAAIKGTAAGLGGLIGGGAGFFGGAGAGSIPGAMVGAGLAGGITEGLMQAANAYIDPDYAKEINTSEALKSVSEEALLDAATAGLFGGAARYGKPALGKFLASGPISTVGKTLSSIFKAGGNAAKTISGSIINTPMAKEAVQYSTPGLGSISQTGFLASLPKEIVSLIPKLLQKTGQSNIGKQILGEEAALGLEGVGSNLLKKRMFATPSEIFNVRYGGTPQDLERATARDVLGNVGELLGKKIFPAEEKNAVGLAEKAFSQGMEQSDADKFILDEIMKRKTRQAASAKFGEAIGAGTEAIGRAGETVTKLGGAATELGLRGVQGAGKAVEEYGRLGKSIFGYSQPIENYLYGRQGLSQYVPKAEEYFLGPRTRQRNQSQDNINYMFTRR